MYKTIRILSLVSLAALVLSLPLPAQGVKDGTGPIHVKTPFDYTGTIIDCLQGDGIILATGQVNVVIYGIGPDSFWTQSGVEKPGVGEEITVTGYAIDYNGEVRNIAYTITVVGEDTVILRDSDGLPLWRTGRQYGNYGRGTGRN